MEERNEELDILICKLYKGNVAGKISNKHFKRMLTEYDREQTELETEMAKLKEQIFGMHEDNKKADKFIAVVRKYTDFTELTTPMLNEFIEKVVVHEATGGRKDSFLERVVVLIFLKILLFLKKYFLIHFLGNF